MQGNSRSSRAPGRSSLVHSLGRHNIGDSANGQTSPAVNRSLSCSTTHNRDIGLYVSAIEAGRGHPYHGLPHFSYADLWYPVGLNLRLAVVGVSPNSSTSLKRVRQFENAGRNIVRSPIFDVPTRNRPSSSTASPRRLLNSSSASSVMSPGLWRNATILSCTSFISSRYGDCLTCSAKCCAPRG